MKNILRISILFLIFAFSAKSQTDKPEVIFGGSSSSIQMPFELSNNHIYIKLKINGSDELYFLFDTGAGASGIMIDSAVAVKIGLKETSSIDANLIGGKKRIPLTDSVFLSLDGVTISRQKAAWFNLKEQEQSEGHTIDGILGYSFISLFEIKIDYNSRLMIIADPVDNSENMAGEKLMLDDIKSNKVPVVEGTVTTVKKKKINTSFIIDTGHDESIILGKQFVIKNNLQNDTLDVQPPRYDSAMGGLTNNKHGKLHDVELGTEIIKNPDVVFSFDEDGVFSDMDGGLIGGGFLKSRTLILNYPKNYIIIK
jgi:hypothetical protein